MNKYEALGRLTEAEEELSQSRKARALLGEQIHKKTEMLILRHKDSDEVTHFNNAIEEVKILLNTYQEKQQEVVEKLQYINELKQFC